MSGAIPAAYRVPQTGTFSDGHIIRPTFRAIKKSVWTKGAPCMGQPTHAIECSAPDPLHDSWGDN